MPKEKKICCRITPGRTLGAVLLGAIVLNLITVGAVYKATMPESAPTDMVTVTQMSDYLTGTFAMLTATEGITPTPTLTLTETATQTPTFTATYTSSPTSTETATSTFANTPSPSPAPCYPRYDWPIYVVQRGDWLIAIARTTGTTDQELRQANCLVDALIYPGQKLYVPRLPIIPTVPTAVPTDIPTDFKLPTMLSCDPPWYVTISVTVFDPQGIRSVTVIFSARDGTFIDDMTMQGDGSTFSAAGPLQGNYNVYAIDHYSFVASDGSQNVVFSRAYYDRFSNCDPPQTVTPTAPSATPSGPVLLYDKRREVY